MKILSTLAVSSLLLVSGFASAGDIQLEENTATTAVANPYALRLEAGLGGYGAAVEYATSEKVSVEAGFSGGSEMEMPDSLQLVIKDNNYNLAYEPKNGFLNLNLRPFSNSFVVTTGVLWQDNTVTVSTDDTDDTVKYRGKYYKLSDLGEVKAEVTFKNELAPYLGIGFSPDVNTKLGMFGQIGVAYVGGSDVKVTSSKLKADDDIIVYNANGAPIQTTGKKVGEVLDEAKSEIKKKIKDYDDFLPMAKIGIVYRF